MGGVTVVLGDFVGVCYLFAMHRVLTCPSKVHVADFVIENI